MKIAYISPYFEPADKYGGPVNSSFTLCKALALAGNNVKVMTTNINGDSKLNVPLKKSTKLRNFEIEYHDIKSGQFFYSPSLVNAIESQIHNFDIVFLQLLWSHSFLPAARSAIECAVPYVIPLRGQLLPWSLNQKRIKKYLFLKFIGMKYLNLATCLYCAHESEEAGIRSLGIQSPTYVSNNMVDESFFEESKPSGYLRTKFGISEESYIILFSGRIKSYKRPDLAVKSIPSQNINGKEVHLVFVGPDPDNFFSNFKIDNTGIKNYQRVHYAGALSREDVRNSLLDSDLLMMPSESESFGMSAAEAMASGVPVITSPYVPVGLMASQVGAGKIVENDPVILEMELKNLLSENEQLEKMKENARRFAREQFHPDIVSKKILDNLTSIVG